jgi:hypothetical protein
MGRGTKKINTGVRVLSAANERMNTMDVINFERLCAELSVAMGGVNAPIATNDQGTDSISLRVDDVDITIARIPAGKALILADFGFIPPDRELAACLALLDFNYLLPSEGAISFGRLAGGGGAVLQASYPLESVTGEQLKRDLMQMVLLARSWRQDFFLNDAGQPEVARAIASVSPALMA